MAKEGVTNTTGIDTGEHSDFFKEVYTEAGDDPARVPWADLAPKPQLTDWLEAHPGMGRRAVDIACGLGDNAEAIAMAGYETLAFDYSEKAVRWARSRFPDSPVDYRVADLFDLPAEWSGAFDLVNECYTLQSMPPEWMPQSRAAVAGLVAPGGILLVYCRIRPDDAEADGPPWPIRESDALAFQDKGLELLDNMAFTVERHGRDVAHWFTQWRRPAR